MAFQENPAVFLQEFGRAVTLTPTQGAPKTSRGIFDAPWVDGAGMGSTSNTLLVPSVDVPANISRGSAVVAGVGTFTVVQPQSDGTGWTTLVLDKP